MGWLYRDLDAELDAVEEALEAGDLQLAAQKARKVVTKWPESGTGWALTGEIAWSLGALADAEEALRRALTLDERDWRSRDALAQVRMEQGAMAEARTLAEESAIAAPGSPDAIWTLAMTLELGGEEAAAEKAYAQAHHLSPELHFLPHRVSRDAFDVLTREAIALLPERIRDALENVEMSVKDFPGPEDTDPADPPLNPLLLGVFLGNSLGQQSLHDPWSTALPARIIIFQKNIERASPTREELVHQIRVTIFHEVGHYLGLSEEEVHGRGLG
jgi:predicted Zn-dependent protease with MMP-like domain